MASEFDTPSTESFNGPSRAHALAMLNASRNLQTIMGIAPGTRMIGKHGLTIVLWEMPKPPASTQTVGALDAEPPIREFQATKTMHVANKTREPTRPAVEVSSGIDADHESLVDEANEGHHPGILQRRGLSPISQGVFELLSEPGNGTHKPSLHVTLSKRKRQVSDAPKPQQHRLPQKRSCDDSKKIISLTQSTALREPIRKRNVRQRVILLDVVERAVDALNNQNQVHNSSKVGQHPTYQPATPPPYHSSSTGSESEKDWPIYWTSDLSRSIRHWLKHPGCKKAQTSLTSLTLASVQTDHIHLGLSCCVGPDGPVDRTNRPQIFEAKHYEKLKIMRLILPSSAQSPLAPPMQLDWLVLVVVSQGISGDGFDSDGEIEGIESDDDLPYLLLAFPTANVTCFHTEAASEPGTIWTNFRLGMEERVPLVHGHGIAKEYVDDFVNACAEGNGAVEMISDGFIPL